MMEAGVMEKKSKSKGHRCYLCGQRFATIHLVRRHVNVHKEKDLECSVCGKFFSSKWGLSKHMGMHTGVRPYKCKYCSQTFRQKGTLTSHVAKIHEGSELYSLCKTCGKSLKAGSREEYCWLCWYKGYSAADEPTTKLDEASELVIIHSDNIDVSNEHNHAERCFNCQTCGKPLLADEHSRCQLCRSVANESALEHEIAVAMISSASSSNVIEHKGTDFVYPFVSMVVEEEEVENNRERSCSQCTLTFPSLVALREHTTEVHKPNWRFSCSICSATFATSDARNHHMIVHKENRPFSCLVCSRTFKNQLGLKNHLQTHRADRPYKCKICGQGFKTQIALRAHAVVHQKERPYICRECGFSFKTIYLLKRHTIVHSGEMPYKCDTCGKQFRYPGNLGRHYFVHTNQRTFPCTICGKTFAQSAGLKQHEQVHNKNFEAEKTLVCPICNKAYKAVPQLRKHLTTHRLKQ